jgi:isopropylmalate/homocitrate/citramalate synthase
MFGQLRHICKLSFDHASSVARRGISGLVVVLDSTVREGELQPGVYFDPKTRKEICLALAETGTRRIEFPIVYPNRGGKISDIQDAIGAVRKHFEEVQTIVQCRACEDDVRNAREYGADGCAVFLGVTEKHRNGKLSGLHKDAAITQLSTSIEHLKDYGFEYRRAVLEDVSRFFTSGKGREDTASYLSRLLSSVRKAGATVVSIPDTSGMLPQGRIADMVKRVREMTDLPLAGHFHNDYGNALANAIEAFQAGVEEIHVSIFGLGARNGIVDHYELVSNLEDLYGVPSGEKRDHLMGLYKKFEHLTGIPIPWRHPLSLSANVEKAGTHQAQIVQAPEGYMPPRKVALDFRGKVYFEASQFISKRVVGQLLKDYRVGARSVLEVTEAVAGTSALKQRKLTSQEVRDIVKMKTGISLPIETVSKCIRGSDYAYIAINYKPQSNGRAIIDELATWREIVQADEVYGDVDLIALTRLRDFEGANVVEKIKEKFREEIVRITTWVVE